MRQYFKDMSNSNSIVAIIAAQKALKQSNKSIGSSAIKNKVAITPDKTITMSLSENVSTI
ncbi:MAG: hypothetical protein LBJ89_03255 [Holosporales bacterium]|nr:hypothetical protein [Holosporales bacterium]